MASLEITSPAAGTEVNPGQTLNIMVNVTGGQPSLVFVIGNPFTFGRATSAHYHPTSSRSPFPGCPRAGPVFPHGRRLFDTRHRSELRPDHPRYRALRQARQNPRRRGLPGVRQTGTIAVSLSLGHLCRRCNSEHHPFIEDELHLSQVMHTRCGYGLFSRRGHVHSCWNGEDSRERILFHPGHRTTADPALVNIPSCQSVRHNHCARAPSIKFRTMSPISINERRSDGLRK